VSPSSKFNATFVLESGQPTTYSANANVSLVAFNGAAVVVTFKTPGELTGIRQFSGLVGGENISITLDNDVTIVGPIVGGPAQSQSISGYGEWAVSV
jgi:hypothetical protein